MEAKELDRKKLTFKQAEGIEQIPQPLKRNEISTELRAVLWAIQHEYLKKDEFNGHISDRWHSILQTRHILMLHKPVDEFDSKFFRIVNEIKNLFFSEKMEDIFEYLTFVMRRPECHPGFYKSINTCLKMCKSPWIIVGEGKETAFYPTSNEFEEGTIEKAFKDLAANDFAGAKKHLIKAAEEFKEGRFGLSMRESISAVESVAKKIVGSESTDLRKALGELEENNIVIHPAFKASLEKMYAFTNDEQGIRHAEVDFSKSDSTDAQFMLGACAAFVSYLIGKARTAKIEVE